MQAWDSGRTTLGNETLGIILIGTLEPSDPGEIVPSQNAGGIRGRAGRAGRRNIKNAQDEGQGLVFLHNCWGGGGGREIVKKLVVTEENVA